MRLCRCEGWVVVRTLKVSERSLYSMRSVIFSPSAVVQLSLVIFRTNEFENGALRTFNTGGRKLERVYSSITH